MLVWSKAPRARLYEAGLMPWRPNRDTATLAENILLWSQWDPMKVRSNHESICRPPLFLSRRTRYVLLRLGGNELVSRLQRLDTPSKIHSVQKAEQHHDLTVQQGSWLISQNLCYELTARNRTVRACSECHDAICTRNVGDPGLDVREKKGKKKRKMNRSVSKHPPPSWSASTLESKTAASPQK